MNLQIKNKRRQLLGFQRFDTQMRITSQVSRKTLGIASNAPTGILSYS